MEKKQEPNQNKEENKKGGKLEGLPMEDSPYLQYKDLEEYKDKAYGTQGHQEPKPGRGAGGSTDAPTISGGAAPDTTNRRGGP
ncbi:hypothetical protein UlMin_039078 [Ulmus minor]